MREEDKKYIYQYSELEKRFLSFLQSLSQSEVKDFLDYYIERALDCENYEVTLRILAEFDTHVSLFYGRGSNIKSITKYFYLAVKQIFDYIDFQTPMQLKFGKTPINQKYEKWFSAFSKIPHEERSPLMMIYDHLKIDLYYDADYYLTDRQKWIGYEDHFQRSCRFHNTQRGCLCWNSFALKHYSKSLTLPTFDEIPNNINPKESLWDWLQKQKKDGK